MEDHEMESDHQQEHIVFHRGDSNEVGDEWDDTALIKAYDEAIKLAHSQVETTTGKSTKQQHKKKKQKKVQSPVTSNRKQWKVGASCRAVYSEDGYVYEAEIIEMIGSDKCIVRYTDYGNEEEQHLGNIYPVQRKDNSRRRHSKTSDTASVNGSIASSSCQSAGRCDHSRASSGHSHPFLMNGLPFIPPPPPSFPEPPCGMDEAMHTMLISWYMSGYHTGYYQGRKENAEQITKDDVR